jgi:hypothetical protein
MNTSNIHCYGGKIRVPPFRARLTWLTTYSICSTGNSEVKEAWSNSEDDIEYNQELIDWLEEWEKEKVIEQITEENLYVSRDSSSSHCIVD